MAVRAGDRVSSICCATRNRRTRVSVGRRLAALTILAALSFGGRAHAQEEQPPPSEADETDETPPPAYPRTPAVQPRAAQRPDIEQPTRRTRTPEPPPTEASPSESYGLQIVLADLGGLVLGGGVSAATGNGVPVVLPWIFASPIVHGVHGHPGTAAISALLHVGAPLVGAIGGAMIPCTGSKDSDVPCELGGALAGFGVGMIGATVIDAAVLAQFAAPPSNRLAREDSAAGLPSLSVGPHGHLSFNWRGTF